MPKRHVFCAIGSRRFSSKAKLNGTTNGHVPSTGASSTVERNKRIRTVRNNNRENSSQGRKTLALEEGSGIR